MSKKINLVMCAVVVAPLFAVGITAAQQESTTPKRDTVTTQAVKTELTPGEKAELKERVAKRKADMKIKLTATEKQRLQNRCKNSQGSLSSLQGRIKGIKTSHDQVYDNLTARLVKLSERLKSQGYDTATLDLQITALQERIVTFKADVAAYELAVGDTAAMECAADPEAFKASLEASRAAREKVKMDSNGIRTFVNETIKPAISQLRQQLESKPATEGEE